MYTSMFRKAMLGDTATLNLDFTTGVLDSRLTFTRAANTATYINSSGYVTTAAANTPRFDYDPVTLAPRGLLIEGSAINLMTYSEDQGNNSTWNAYSTSVTRTTGQTDPENTTTATKILFDATSADAVISRSVTISNATAYTISVWMRADSGTVSNVRFGRAAAASGAIFPTLTTTWQRVQLAFTSSGTSDGIEIRVLTSGSPKTATIHIWGAQLEAGSGASSYIPTVASQVTRNPDYCQSTVASGIAGWLTSLTTSTYFVDFVPMTQRGAFANTWNTRTSTFQGYEIYCFDGTAGVNLTCTTKISASTNVETNVASGLALNSRHKIAYSISAGSGLRSVNGSTASAANPVALPTGTPSTFGVGSGGGGSGTSINAWIRSVKYYPTALTQTEINGMTAA